MQSNLGLRNWSAQIKESLFTTVIARFVGKTRYLIFLSTNRNTSIDGRRFLRPIDSIETLCAPYRWHVLNHRNRSLWGLHLLAVGTVTAVSDVYLDKEIINGDSGKLWSIPAVRAGIVCSPAALAALAYKVRRWIPLRVISKRRHRNNVRIEDGTFRPNEKERKTKGERGREVIGTVEHCADCSGLFPAALISISDIKSNMNISLTCGAWNVTQFQELLSGYLSKPKRNHVDL